MTEIFSVGLKTTDKSLKANNLFTLRRASKDYKRSLQRQFSDEVLEKRASKKRELTQIIKYSLRAI